MSSGKLVNTESAYNVADSQKIDHIYVAENHTDVYELPTSYSAGALKLVTSTIYLRTEAFSLTIMVFLSSFLA